MPADFYKLLHLIGVFMVLMTVASLAMHAINGGEKDHGWRRPAMIFHGLGLVLVLLGGFGLLAKLKPGGEMFPSWAFIKVGIWFVFGGLTAVIAKKREWAKGLWYGTLVLASVAAGIGLYWEVLF
ncbi:MAG: hypothetical protein VX938_02740 [Myxococcota bacterium]|nr:hypothetical protein [Myxococcota bacterium]MEE2779427.1 hypothetical protein [Myxococcota bacterium]